jgi:hypothetical protein
MQRQMQKRKPHRPGRVPPLHKLVYKTSHVLIAQAVFVILAYLPRMSHIDVPSTSDLGGSIHFTVAWQMIVAHAIFKFQRRNLLPPSSIQRSTPSPSLLFMTASNSTFSRPIGQLGTLSSTYLNSGPKSCELMRNHEAIETTIGVCRA